MKSLANLAYIKTSCSKLRPNQPGANSHGLSLLELLIALAISGILLSLAYPSYQGHLVKVRRSEAQVALAKLSLQLERYYTEHHSFTGVSLSSLGIPSETPHHVYRLEIVNLTQDNHYLIRAIPVGSQAERDILCGSLMLDGLGQRGQTGVGTRQDCW